jgi:hypothetical protein
LSGGLFLGRVKVESAIVSMGVLFQAQLGHDERIVMSDALSFAEIDGQHVELLPARTVLSLFSAGGCGCGGHGGGGGDGGTGGNGGNAQGGLGINLLSGIGILGTGVASAGDATGGNGGSANGGRG